MEYGTEDGLGHGFVHFFHDVHGGFEAVREEGDGDLADLGHALLWWVLEVFLNGALLSSWFGVVFLEETVADPSLTRAGQGLG